MANWAIASHTTYTVCFYFLYMSGRLRMIYFLENRIKIEIVESLTQHNKIDSHSTYAVCVYFLHIRGRLRMTYFWENHVKIEIVESLSQNNEIASHTTYAACCYFLYMSGRLRITYFWENFHGIFIYTQNFFHKSAEIRSPKKYFFIFRFDIRPYLIQTGHRAETITYPEAMASPAPPLDSLGPQCVEGALTSYLDLVVTSSRLQWPCLQINVLWADTQKQCGSHLTTSFVDADQLRKRKLLSTFSVNFHLLPGAAIAYLAVQPLSAWRSYRPLRSRI